MFICCFCAQASLAISETNHNGSRPRPRKCVPALLLYSEYYSRFWTPFVHEEDNRTRYKSLFPGRQVLKLCAGTFAESEHICTLAEYGRHQLFHTRPHEAAATLCIAAVCASAKP